MKKLILITAAALALPACSSINIPLGASAKYGTLTVGYQPPSNLPYGIDVPATTLHDK